MDPWRKNDFEAKDAEMVGRQGEIVWIAFAFAFAARLEKF